MNGNPVVGFPVRFTECCSRSAAARPCRRTLRRPRRLGCDRRQGEQSVFLTGPDGVVRATLPVANYSVYAFGLNGTPGSRDVQTAYLNASSAGIPARPVDVSNAVELSGTVTGSPSTSGRAGEHGGHGLRRAGPPGLDVREHDPVGTAIWLSAGRYTVLASAIVPNSSAPPVVFAARSVCAYPTDAADLPRTPGSSSAASSRAPERREERPVPGRGRARDGHRDALNATVTRPWPTGTGNITLALPAIVPSGTSFCVAATASGFEPYQACNFTASELGFARGDSPRALPGPAELHRVGLPGGTKVTVNFTALTSPGGVDREGRWPDVRVLDRPRQLPDHRVGEVPERDRSPAPPEFAQPDDPPRDEGDERHAHDSLPGPAVGHLVLPTEVTNSSVSSGSARRR